MYEVTLILMEPEMIFLHALTGTQQMLVRVMQIVITIIVAASYVSS